MIREYGCRETRKVSLGEPTKKWQDIRERAQMKLDMLNAASELKDLQVPPGNKLKRLDGRLSDYHSIRINRQWRVIFIWKDSHAYDVKIVDYH